MAKVKVNSVYVYSPNSYDLFDARTDLQDGELVRVVNLPGCPPANTMGMCHVNDMSGNFKGLVCVASLTLASKVNKQ